ncbi:interleukin 2 receptor, gamma b [Salminus brasiliensis]|uniref:interleukin 2 receptor, gamma b n=1 Tax=Salminus brasiliensis TaxID=930266 RepID=UPI003B82DE3F
MVCLLASKILFGFLLLSFFPGCWSRTPPPPDGGCMNGACVVDISCMFINLEYVVCNWTRPQNQNMSYNFSSTFSSKKLYRECPQYLQEHGQNVGCKISDKNVDHFSSLYTKLSIGRNQSVLKDYEQLSERVKLNPPYNISVNWTGPNGNLCLSWVSSISKKNCVRYRVRYWRDQRQVSHETAFTLYCVPYVSKGVNFTFQVSSKLASTCGDSKFWSEWSDPVHWGNYTGNVPASAQPLWHVWVTVLGVVVLISLAMLLCYCERIMILLLPVVPDPRKNLEDLFREHNGNVESWVLSSGLKEAFETDYTESSCVVCELSPSLKVKECDGPQ